MSGRWLARTVLIGASFGWAASALALGAGGHANVGTLIPGAVIGLAWLAYLATKGGAA